MRIKIINGIRHGYYDLLNKQVDPADPQGLILLAMCLLQQAGINFPVDYEGESQELEEFNYNGLGIQIRWMGQDYFLRTKALVDEDELFKQELN